MHDARESLMTANPASTQTARRAIDWEAIERDYRAGLKSLREMGGEHGVSAPAILKRAKRDGWTRDLSAKIKAKADALVNSAEVNGKVNAVTAADERVVVEANATAIMRVRLTHRQDIARARTLAMTLLGELEQGAAAKPLLERLAALVAEGVGMDPIAVAKQAAQLEKALELSTRTATMKMLADTLTKLIALEREAYSLASEGGKDQADTGEQLADLLKQIDGAGTGLPAHAAGGAA